MGGLAVFWWGWVQGHCQRAKQGEEMSPVDIMGRYPSSGSSKCKGPEAGKNLMCVRDAQRTKWLERRVVAEWLEVRASHSLGFHVPPVGCATLRILFSGETVSHWRVSAGM